jgi:hypothetical protein
MRAKTEDAARNDQTDKKTEYENAAESVQLIAADSSKKAGLCTRSARNGLALRLICTR